MSYLLRIDLTMHTNNFDPIVLLERQTAKILLSTGDDNEAELGEVVIEMMALDRILVKFPAPPASLTKRCLGSLMGWSDVRVVMTTALTMSISYDPNEHPERDILSSVKEIVDMYGYSYIVVESK